MNAIPMRWADAAPTVGPRAADHAGDDPAAGERPDFGVSARIGATAARSVEAAARVVTPPIRSGVVRIRGSRRLGLGLIAAGVCVILWIGVLAAQTPVLAEASNWNAAWIGLDALEGAGLVSTGLLLRRQDPRMCLAAAATAMLLFVDAWFDVMTATAAERPLSIAMAVLVELPIGSLCARLALRGMRAG
jgi:hypothetical protein